MERYAVLRGCHRIQQGAEVNPTGGRTELASFFRASLDAYRATREGDEGIAQRQQQRLGDIVAYARTHSPYYRQLYRHVPEGFSDISRFPAVTKTELMSQFDDWVTDPAVTRASVEAFLSDPGNIGRDYLGRYVVCTTSGATGSGDPVARSHRIGRLSRTRLYPFRAGGVPHPAAHVGTPARRGRLAAVYVTGGHFLGNTMMARIRKMPWRARMQRIFSAPAPVGELVADLNAFQPGRARWLSQCGS